MKHRDNHLDQDKLMEYFYNESPIPGEIKSHLLMCKKCQERYLGLKKDMESISDFFKHTFWLKQREKVMSGISGINGAKDASYVKWLRPALVATVLIFLFAGIYSRLNRIPIIYTEKDISEEIFLEHVSELVKEPLTLSLDYLDFQEEILEDDQEDVFTGSLGKLELFGYWPELGA